MASVKIVGGISIGIGIWIWIWISMVQLMQVAECDPNTSIGIWRCNNNEYSATDPFADYLVDLLNDLRISTPANEDYDYYNFLPTRPTPVIYGHATCNRGLSNKDCGNCVSAASAAVEKICRSKIGGYVELGDCTIRYENYYFT